MDLLAPPDIHALPPDCLLDGNHPAADEYIQATRRIQRLIVSASAQLKPRQVEAIKLHHTGHSNTRIAEKLGVSIVTISRYIRLPKAKKLLNLLRAYQSAIDGPNKAQRINMLWRIARLNELDQPKTSIAALAELNRMDTQLQHDLQQSGTNQPQTLTIEINQKMLPRTALDCDIPAQTQTQTPTGPQDNEIST